MTDNKLIKIGEDNEAEYFNGLFEGKKVGFRKDKATGEIHLNQSDVAAVLGFESVDTMMFAALNDRKASKELKTAAKAYFTKKHGINHFSDPKSIN